MASPWTAARVLKAQPSLSITADLSHWVVASERLLTTPADEEALAVVLPRVAHVHGRVGTPQSPQLMPVARYDPTMCTLCRPCACFAGHVHVVQAMCQGTGM